MTLNALDYFPRCAKYPRPRVWMNGGVATFIGMSNRRFF